MELQEIGRREQVDEERDQARSNRAKENCRIGRRIIKQQQNAVAAGEAKRQQRVAPARGVLAQFRVTAPTRWSDGGEAIAATLAQVLE